MHKIKIVTADPSFLQWKTLASKQKEILDALHQTKNSSFLISFSYQDVVPTTNKEGRINHSFIESISKPWFDKGYDFVAFHISENQRKVWKIEPNVRGLHWNDPNEINEMYVWADETTIRSHRLNQFIQTLLHEFCHAYFKGANQPDRTHQYHGANPDIKGIFQSFDMALFNPVRAQLRKKISELQIIFLSLLRKLNKPQPRNTIFHPVPYPYRDNITQAYGVPSSRYPLTQHHIGVDYGCPVGTNIVAPADGSVTTVGYTKTLGNYLHFQYQVNDTLFTERYVHLHNRPKLGTFKKGDIVTQTENTGQSYGPHLHRDVWVGDVNLTGINANNFRQRTADPETLFDYED